MAAEDELLSLLREWESIRRQAVHTLHRNLLIKNEFHRLLREAYDTREMASDTRESALRVRDDAIQKRLALSRILPRQNRLSALHSSRSKRPIA